MRLFSMMQRLFVACRLTLFVLILGAGACDPSSTLRDKPSALVAESHFHPDLDIDQRACHVRRNALLSQPDVGGTPAYDAMRAEILGRAWGEPMVFMREPTRLPIQQLSASTRTLAIAFDRAPHGVRVDRLLRQARNQPALLRSILLPEGYVYASDPLDALEVVRSLQLPLLFQEPVIWLQRQAEVVRLERFRERNTSLYRYAEGPYQGQPASLQFGDRLAISPAEFANPLHRDLRTLARDVGFDRVRIEHRVASALVVQLRFGTRWVRGVLTAQGASLQLACLDEPRATVEWVEAWMRENGHQIRARRAMEAVIDTEVRDALPFDRPIDAEDHFSDGALRPLWFDAYRRGQTMFSHQGRGYPVYRSDGIAWPPQVCVDLVLETYERTSGTWYRPRGQPPERIVGRLDFDAEGITNRRGVLAFGTFAESSPGLFEYEKLEDRNRIPFAKRKEFFAYLLEHADDFGPGHVVAIQGKKRDGHIHQHAIFVETTDPVTGFPYGLFDQMKKPRRRTWEGIMAEAPARSLYYHVRPTDKIWRAMDPQPGQIMPSPLRRLVQSR